MNDVKQHFEELLKQFVEIPTVSADPERASDIRRAADLAIHTLESFGATTELTETDGNPVVTGLFTAPNAKRTVTIYNHLDVQPADEPEWRREPFVFEKKDDKYFGRGSTDDKGPALTALFAAAEAVQQKIPLNIRFIWELEEEIGSPHFEQFLKKKQKALKTDSVVVIDSVWISEKTPVLYYGLRGNITGTMYLETAERAVHSGTAGGVAVNPLFELSRAVSQLYEPKSGKVLVPGFYEGIVTPSARERKNFRSSGFDLKNWAKSYQLKRLQTNKSIDAIQRIWCRPTFEVNGIVGGYTGPGVKTAIPPRAELKFSCRLAPNQDPKKISQRLEKQIRKLNPNVKVVFHSLLRPFLGPFTGPYADAASAAFEHGFSRRPVFARAGGSDGSIILLHEYLKAPIILMGLSLPDHGYHAPNEYFDWRQASRGMKSLVKYFEKAACI